MRYEIYKITNRVNNKIYIGLTNQTISVRFSKHLNEALKTNSQYALHRAFRKYGVENFTVELVEQCSSLTELKEREIYWIDYYQSHVKHGKGYNMTEGGDGTMGLECKEETRKKLSFHHNSRKRPVSQYDLNGKFIKEFDSLNDVVKEFDLIGPRYVHTAIKFGSPLKGFLWKDDFNRREIKEVITLISGQETLKFPSIRQLSDHLNFPQKLMYERLQGYNKIKLIDKDIIILIEDGEEQRYREVYLNTPQEKSPETIEKIKKTIKEYRENNPDFNVKLQKTHPGNKAILQLNLDGSIHKEYISLREAVRETSYTRNTIKHAVRKSNIGGDFIWVWKENFPLINEEYLVSLLDKNTSIITKKRKVIQMDLEGNKIAEFKNCAEAAKMNNISIAPLNCCCNNKPGFKTAGGFKWKYESI